MDSTKTTTPANEAAEQAQEDSAVQPRIRVHQDFSTISVGPQFSGDDVQPLTEETARESEEDDGDDNDSEEEEEEEEEDDEYIADGKEKLEDARNDPEDSSSSKYVELLCDFSTLRTFRQ